MQLALRPLVHRVGWWTVLGVTIFAAGKAYAASPVISTVAPRGLQTGTTTAVTVTGSELTGDVVLLAPIPGMQQQVRAGSSPQALTIEVTLAKETPPGIYPAWIAGSGGVTAIPAVGVDHLPQQPFAETIASLPVALHGTLTGSQVLRTSFTGTANQRMVIEVEGKRLGVPFNPMLHLYDSRNVQIAWAQGTPSLGGDARLVTQLPADGAYTIELHDALYRGQEPGYFRLKVGDFHFADLVYPLGVNHAQPGRLELVAGSVPAGTVTDILPQPMPGPALAPMPFGLGLSGAQPRLVASNLNELTEEAVAGGQSLAVGAAVSGRLSGLNEEDRYTISVTQGQALRFDVVAAQVGSPLDAVLTLKTVEGAELAKGDDRPNTSDPLVDFTIPAGTDRIVAAITDLQGRGGASYVYRLAVQAPPAADFSVDVLADKVVVPRRGTAVVRVRANRSGYNGPIELSFPELPPGLSLASTQIPEGGTDTLLSISASETAAAQALTRLEATATAPGANIRHSAEFPDSPLARLSPSLRLKAPLTTIAEAPLVISWTAQSEIGSGYQLPRGARIPVAVHLARLENGTGPVRLSLLTSQVTPKKDVQKDGVNTQVDDPDRTIRMDGQNLIAADQNQATVDLVVPADLPDLPYDLAIKTELLAADNTTVTATAVTPARRYRVGVPFVLELAGEPKVQALAGSGQSGSLNGVIRRSKGFVAPVKVTLAGLPAELPVPAIDVAGDQTQFSLPVEFPYGAAPGELAGVRVVAESAVAPSITVRSNELQVAIAVVPGGPPPALYRIFEDEPHVVPLLAEGAGQVSLEKGDRLAGDASLKVTPDQRFRAKMPGLGVKIAEQPSDGEFRYLRFAWKKKGGTNVLLQLNANGDWGASRDSGKPGYRYEAGTPNQYSAEAIKLSDQLPDTWVVVTRDLFADFGAFSLDGVALTAADGEFALFDHIYLARTEADLAGCPTPPPAEQPLAVFEDQQEFIDNLTEGNGQIALFTEEKLSGAASAKVSGDQKANAALPGLGVKIRQNPGPGEYRYLQFAWKKQGGERVCLQLNHDGMWGPSAQSKASFRYDAGPGAGESYGAALRVDNGLPSSFVIVTRDLYSDFGEFTLTGLALSSIDGEYALFDHIYLGRNAIDFDLVRP